MINKLVLGAYKSTAIARQLEGSPYYPDTANSPPSPPVGLFITAAPPHRIDSNSYTVLTGDASTVLEIMAVIRRDQKSIDTTLAVDDQLSRFTVSQKKKNKKQKKTFEFFYWTQSREISLRPLKGGVASIPHRTRVDTRQSYTNANIGTGRPTGWRVGGGGGGGENFKQSP